MHEMIGVRGDKYGAEKKGKYWNHGKTEWIGERA